MLLRRAEGAVVVGVGKNLRFLLFRNIVKYGVGRVVMHEPAQPHFSLDGLENRALLFFVERAPEVLALHPIEVRHSSSSTNYFPNQIEIHKSLLLSSSSSGV